MSPRPLVADGDAALNLALRAHFEDRGGRATGGPDCVAALAALAGATFDVVLLDVQSPDGDGVELLGRNTPPIRRRRGAGYGPAVRALRLPLRRRFAPAHL